MKKIEDFDKMEEDNYIEEIDEIDELCNRFDDISLGHEGVYLKHVTGKILFVPYIRCGLYHTIAVGNVMPIWTSSH